MTIHHKSEDYKLSAVQHYLESDKTQEETCSIFKCSSRSLMRWVDRYHLKKVYPDIIVVLSLIK